MNVKSYLRGVGVLLAIIMFIRSTYATLPENYLNNWDDPAIQQRIDNGIERNRKSDVVLTIVDAAGAPIPSTEVNVAQTSHEFLFGCNLFVLGQMKEKNAAYEALFLKLFNFTTIAFYWDDLEPESGALRFAEGSPFIWRRPPPDRAVAFGKRHGLILKGHPLMWHNVDHNPRWIPEDPDALRRRYLRRFQEIAARYADDIPIWDGVNESLVCKPDFPLYSQANQDCPPYVPWAFTEQQKLFRPDNILMINDVTSFNWPSNETNRYYRQCVKLLDDGIGIEGIGFQFHFFNRKSLHRYIGSDRCDPAALLDTYEMFAKLDLPLWITEITIGSAGTDGPAVQERVVRDIYRLWFSVPKMAGITWWNLGDGTAYGNEGVAGGGLTDREFNPKPAYRALDQLINHDWMTVFQTKTDRNGQVKFRGFHGHYTVDVKQGDKHRQFEVMVHANDKTKAILTIP